MRFLAVSLAIVCTLVASTDAAADEPPRWHAMLGGAHAFGDPQEHEFGFGALGSLALEIPFAKVLGVQGEVSGVWLPHANPPTDPRIADHGDGTYFGAMLGLRLRPLGATERFAVAGPWLDMNAGYVHTGGLSRGGFDTHIGWDFRIGHDGRWDVGPFVGYTQVLQPSDTLRPKDAHIVSLGVQISLGAPFPAKPPPPAQTAPPPPPPPPLPPPPPPDRDGDGILDADDACPDVKGVHTNDPKTNGCPPPPPDRDNDGIPDADDACPDQPGPKDPDPKKNGCPVQGIHFERDQIVLDDVILFELNVGRVRHYSFPLVQRLAQFINAHPEIVSVSIEGHTDESGSAQYNRLLSLSRAESVKNLLIRFGVDRKRLTTQGWGKDRPIDLGHDEDAHKRNRRVEFIVTRERQAPSDQGAPPKPGGP
jgi:outer membrane protein OmpA-like peptidoglycan-associated protein